MSPDPRRYRRTSDDGRRWLTLALVAGLVVLAFALPSSAFSLMNAGRGGAVPVAGDQGGVMALTPHTCVDKDTVDPLVDVQNNFGSSLSVTVSLVDPTLGTLHVGGQSGDTVTVSLASGGTDTVSFETTANGPWPKTLDYTVDGVSGGTSASAARTSSIEQNCGSSTPTPTPTPTATPVPGNDPPVADFTMTAGQGNEVTVDASASTDPDGTIVSYEWYVNNQAATGNPDATGVTATLKPVKAGDTITLVVTDDDGATDKLTKTA